MTLFYIDPGTGSMLFSIFIGAAATLYFLARTVIIRAKVFFSGGRAAAAARNTQKYVIYAEDKRYWNLFRPVLDEFEKRATPLLYLTSSPDDPCFDARYQYISSEYAGEGNRAYARLNILNAEFVLMTTPGLDVYQMKRSKLVKHYSHLLHAPSDATMYRLFGIDYFDSVLLTGDYQAEDIRALEKMRGLPEKQLVTVGCPYLDVAEKAIAEIPPEEKHPFTVLVSPSWGPSALLSRYGESLLDPLAASGFRIIVRPHPQSAKSEATILERLETRYRDRANIEWDRDSNNIYSLKKADVMISDFSGIIFDYVFLCDRPVLYADFDFDSRPYDADDLDRKPWQFGILKEIGVALHKDEFASVGDIIRKASESTEMKEARRKAKETAWQYRGGAGKKIADFMIETAGK